MPRRTSGPGGHVAVTLLLAALDEAFDRRAWHGTTLRGSIRGLGAADTVWRPAAGRHNIWEIVDHCAYWKYAVRRRLVGLKRGSFAQRGSNWFPTPKPATESQWRATVSQLTDEHRQLRAVVAGLSDSTLPRRAMGGSDSNAALIRGIAAHDLYHAGQVQLLKRLRRGESRS